MAKVYPAPSVSGEIKETSTGGRIFGWVLASTGAAEILIYDNSEGKGEGNVFPIIFTGKESKINSFENGIIINKALYYKIGAGTVTGSILGEFT